MRTTNTAKHGYCWQYTPEAAHLFSKCLSRQTLSAYKQICSGVGKSFEAIIAPRACEDISSSTNLVLPQSTPHLPVSNNCPEIESFSTHEAYDLSTELLHELHFSIQQSLVEEREERERQESELRRLQAEYGRLTEKYNETTDAMCGCLRALGAIAALVEDLREEISESIKRTDFTNLL